MMDDNKALSEKDYNMSIYPGDEEEHMFLRKDVKEAVDKLIRDFCLCRDDYACWNCKNIKEIFGEL